MAEHLKSLIAATAAIAVAAAGLTGLTGCGSQRHNAAGTVEVAPTPTVSAADLVRQWQHHLPPCEHPIGVSTKPADPYHLIEPGMWPTSADVASRLDAVTAAGEPDFILGRLQLLDAVLLQTQSDIAERVVSDTHALDSVGGNPEGATAANIIRDESARAIKLRHDNYVAAVDHVVFELEAGAVLPSAQIGHRFRVDKVCPAR